MVKTQVQIPDELYREAKRIAREREMSFAEVVRRGLEYIVRVYPPLPRQREWSPPAPRAMGWKGLAHVQVREAALEDQDRSGKKS
jgi:hypothetical protein